MQFTPRVESSRVGDLLQLSAFFILKSPRGLLTETHHQQGGIWSEMVYALKDKL